MNTNKISTKQKPKIDPFDVIDIQEDNRIQKKIKYMKLHKCHDYIYKIPNIMKQSKSWLYSNHMKEPSDKDGIRISYKKTSLMTFEQMVHDNDNRMYYNFRLNNDFIVIDLDDCFDKCDNLLPFAKEVISIVKDMNPYIERSLSRTGLHVILKSSKSWNDLKTLSVKLKNKHQKYSDLSRRSGIEIFNSNHCITLTGDVFENYNPNTLGTVKRELKVFYDNLKELDKKDKNKSKSRLEKKKFNNSVDKEDIFSVINTMVSIEQVLELYGIEFNDYQHINCPLPDHMDRTPSFWIYNYSNTWYCFGCNKGGDVVHLVAELENMREIDAAKKLNENFELNLDFNIYNKNLDEEWIIVDDKDKISIDVASLRNHLFEDHNIIVTEQDIYIYEDGFYKAKNSFEIKKIIELHMPGVYNNKFKHSTYIDEVFKQLCRNFTSYDKFNRDNYSVNFKNCILKFKHGSDEIEIMEHSPDYLTTMQINGEYDDSNFCPIWDKFLKESLEPDQIILLQEWAGYALINNNNAKKFVGFYGKGDSGKSVTLEAIVRMVGGDYASAVPLQKLTDKNHTFSSSGLRGKLINVCGDIPAKCVEDTSLVKSLTSTTDKIMFEKKGKDAIFAYNTARMYFSMNKLPAVRDKSKEFFNRFIIIPFNNVCPEDKIEPELINMFNIEGIITWAVEGLKRLLKNKFKFSETETNKNLIRHYIELDSPVVDFISNHIEFNDDSEITQKTLLEGFKFFCKHMINNEYSAKMKMNTFIDEINNNFDLKFSKHIYNPVTKKNSARGFKGINFTSDFLAEMEAYSVI